MIEAGVTLLSILIALFWPRIASKPLASAERWFTRLARRRALGVVTVGIAAGVLRLSIIPWVPIPQPFIHDEFSYLLAADTFASGRLTNPTHPMWRYLEGFHITQQPTYMSMYFPAQGLVLAAGQVLLSHPWYGVLISASLMCSAMCWMLQGWLPPRWALLGGWLAVLRLALFSYWINMYYGGAVAAIGGCLVLGALPRLMRNLRIRDGVLMALGAIILANSRPYEGVLVCLPVAGRLLWWAARETNFGVWILVRRLLAPAALLLAAAGFTAYYDYRVFGDVFTLPYQVNRATYAVAPVFLWQAPKPEPSYRYQTMRNFYTKWELGDFQKARSLSGFLNATAQKAGVILLFYFGVTLMPPLIALPCVFRDRRIRFLTIAAGVYIIGLSANAWLFPHYVAPFVGGVYAMLLQAMRHLRVWRRRSHPSGLLLVRVIPLICIAMAGVRLFADRTNVKTGRWPTVSLWYGMQPVGLARARIATELEGRVGRHLAIVRYPASHIPFDDWVYNKADIDSSKVVWARESETGSNSELLRYFKGRSIWLVEPDCNPPKLSQYVVDKSELAPVPKSGPANSAPKGD